MADSDADNPTVEDFIQGWADTYYSDTLPDERAEEVLSSVKSNMLFDLDAEVTDWKRKVLQQALMTSRTVSGVVHDTLTRFQKEGFDEGFADLITPPLSEKIIPRLSGIDTPNDDLPMGIGPLVAKGVREMVRNGDLEEEVQLYKQGRLEDALDRLD